MVFKGGETGRIGTAQRTHPKLESAYCYEVPDEPSLRGHDKSKPQGGKLSIRAVPAPVGRTAGPGVTMDASAAKYFCGT